MCGCGSLSIVSYIFFSYLLAVSMVLQAYDYLLITLFLRPHLKLINLYLDIHLINLGVDSAFV